MSNTKQRRGFVIFTSIIAALAGLQFGFDTGVISGALLFFRKTFALNAHQVEVIVSAVLLGAFVGALSSGRLTDRYGRRRLLIIIALLFSLSSLSCALASTANILMISRFFLGIAIGVGSFIAPLYISEIAPFEARGALVSLNQLAVTIGIVLSYLVDYAFAKVHGGWRFMFGMGVIPGVLLFIGMFFLPRSPRWLVLTGKIDEAKAILAKIRHQDNIESEINAILVSNENHRSSNWRMLFSQWVRPVLMIAIGLEVFQQVTGINTIIYYAPTILEIAGFHTARTAILATALVGTINVTFTIIALPLIDKWGRRPLLLMGLIGMGISLLYLSYTFAYPPHGANLRWLTLGSMLVYIACFAASLGPICFLIPAEIFPLQIRGLGMSMAVACNWACNLVVALTFLSLIKLIHPQGTFLLFGGLCVLGLLFIYFFVPETKGVSLEQIEKNLRAGVSTRKLGDADRSV